MIATIRKSLKAARLMNAQMIIMQEVLVNEMSKKTVCDFCHTDIADGDGGITVRDSVYAKDDEDMCLNCYHLAKERSEELEIVRFYIYQGANGKVTDKSFGSASAARLWLKERGMLAIYEIRRVSG